MSAFLIILIPGEVLLGLLCNIAIPSIPALQKLNSTAVTWIALHVIEQAHVPSIKSKDLLKS